MSIHPLNHRQGGAGMSEIRHPTRQQVIIFYINRMLIESGQSLINFSREIAVHYHALVPEHAQSTPLKVVHYEGNADSFYKIQESNTKLLQRWLDGSTKLPAEVVEALVAALPEPYKSRCITDLCTRMGVLPIRIEASNAITELSDVMREGAEALAAEAPMLADGVIDEKDAEHAQKAAREHLEAGAAHLQRAFHICEKAGVALPASLLEALL